MKTRRLSQGMIETYNNRFRIRLKPLPGADHDLVVIYHLKENKFYRDRTVMKVENGITMAQLVELTEVLEESMA